MYQKKKEEACLIFFYELSNFNYESSNIFYDLSSFTLSIFLSFLLLKYLLKSYSETFHKNLVNPFMMKNFNIIALTKFSFPRTGP